MTGLLIVLGLIALALFTPRYGVDLRDGSDWRYQRDQTLAPSLGPRHTPRSDLAALGRWMSWVGGMLARRWDARERAWGAHQLWRGDEPPLRLDDMPTQRTATAGEPGATAGKAQRTATAGEPGATAGEPGAGERGAGERGAGERGRHHGELHWREEGGSWRLEGQLLPANPAAGDQSNEHPAHLD